MKLYTIGCSFTEGQGLDNHHNECYSHILSENLDTKHFNFGACGASNDYIFRKIFELLNSNIITKDDIIVIQWTHYMRKELPIVYDDKEFYHFLPTTFYPYNDKIITSYGPNNELVTNKYIQNESLDEIKKIIENENKEFLNIYNLKFLNEEYQINTTKNYINSLYAYLEHFGYKHIHFFGWDSCIIDGIVDNSNFLKETFGGFSHIDFSQSKLIRHPNKNEHENWANFLYKKIKLNYNL